ncbi:hypothetical protein [Actinotalea subterranea]|uniref:hypothetical protein n=1 Tax=Actinotalea subterranea TaxID=2607497 RepID=UPI0011F0730C|nr:hypothetical protein [Actinotalea subterranea]
MTTTMTRPGPTTTSIEPTPRGDAAARDHQDAGTGTGPWAPAPTAGTWAGRVAVGVLSITLGCLYIATYVTVGVVRKTAHLLSAEHRSRGRCATCGQAGPGA